MTRYLIEAGIFLGFIAVIAAIGFQLGADHVQSKWDKAKAATVETKLDTKGKQDEINNAPIDIDVTVRRLLNGSF